MKQNGSFVKKGGLVHTAVLRAWKMSLFPLLVCVVVTRGSVPQIVRRGNCDKLCPSIVVLLIFLHVDKSNLLRKPRARRLNVLLNFIPQTKTSLLHFDETCSGCRTALPKIWVTKGRKMGRAKVI